ncbi:cupin domain-containing protein [Thaumasiovibrio subtropicus]|uniref:cupin domain-containing protein n=1 Tax=Thaumasiovibrio subtropicus TaxID=1891207 RepID=UPI000B35E707|nr:cupin domain-containing protein [Thaumasiovibrio subtropicus]
MLNMDFSVPIALCLDDLDWQHSPANGVMRKPLERSAPESGYTTSIVEYQKGTSFAPHPHPIGEEIFILEGIFSDEYGDYPAGTYLRNAPGSNHSPFSYEGCILFVKLNQFHPDDTEEVRIDTAMLDDSTKPHRLHQHRACITRLLKTAESADVPISSPNAKVEFLVIEGSLKIAEKVYQGSHWIRLPHFDGVITTANAPTRILIKQG